MQNVKKKWLMNILCIHVEQIFKQLTQRHQVGCIKGRQMLHHIWGVCSSYDAMQSGALVTFDYSNAFPSLTHQYIAAVLELIHLPATYIAFVLDVLSPLPFLFGKGGGPRSLPAAGSYSLHAQFGTPFHAYLKDHNIFPQKLVTHFTSWCQAYGVQLHAWALPYLQLGPIPYKTFDYLSYSMKSFSIDGSFVLDGLVDQSMIGQLPLWHSAVFKSELHPTYYSPKLISMNILIVADLFDEHPHAHLLKYIGPTWQDLYRNAPRNMLIVQVTDWSLPSVWTAAWAKSLTLKRLAANLHTETRCSPRVWQVF